MQIRCLQCDLVIPNALRPNDAKNLLCPHCGESFGKERFREMTDADFGLTNIPKGISFEETDQRWRLVASLRALVEGTACLGITVGIAVGLFWGMNRTPELSSNNEAAACVLFVMLCLAAWQTALQLWGTTTVTIEGDHGDVFTGVGHFGSGQLFDWSQITRIEDKQCHGGRNYYFAIVLHGSTETQFGRWLSTKRRHYVWRAMRRLKLTQQRAVASNPHGIPDDEKQL